MSYVYQLYESDNEGGNMSFDRYIDYLFTIYSVGCPAFYQNEINAYEAEIKEWPDTSPAYTDERNYLLWLKKEYLKISQKYYNK